MAPERVEVESPVIHLVTAPDEPSGENRLGFVLGVTPAHTGNSHEVGRLRNHRVDERVDRIQHSCGGIGHSAILARRTERSARHEHSDDGSHRRTG